MTFSILLNILGRNILKGHHYPKKIGIMIIAGFLCLSCQQQPVEQANSTEMGLDSTLATELGADDYGKHQYVMAFLKAGPNRSQDSLTAANLQRAHLDNITRLANEGKLVLAGPFLDNGEIRGIYIFDVKTIEEAQELTATDPAINSRPFGYGITSLVWIGCVTAD